MEEKKIQIMDLLSYAIGIPEMKYFNLDSDELLDEKIEVLTQIKEGKTIAEIGDVDIETKTVTNG